VEELDYILTNFINLVKKNVERRKSKNTTLRIFMYMVKYTKWDTIIYIYIYIDGIQVHIIGVEPLNPITNPARYSRKLSNIES
jgi:hypothetical protein